MKFAPYLYKVLDWYVIDGDTLDLTIDLGFGLTYKFRGRLIGVDAPDISAAHTEDEKEKAYAAKDYLERLLKSYKDKLYVMCSQKPETFNRWLVDLLVIDEKTKEYISLNEKMALYLSEKK